MLGLHLHELEHYGKKCRNMCVHVYLIVLTYPAAADRDISSGRNAILVRTELIASAAVLCTVVQSLQSEPDQSSGNH